MRRYAAVVIVLLLCLWIGLAAAQTDSSTSVPYVYRIKIDGCAFEPVARRQTGFQVQGLVGIVTALHGVADCQTVSAVADDGVTLFTDLVITAVDIDRDMALLTSPVLEKLPADGLAASMLSNSEVLTATLRIVGYPLGLDKQDVDVIESVRDIESLDDVIPDPEESVEFLKRNSPNIRIDVLNLQAQLVPGHSGAPVIDAEGYLVAIGNGGLRGGTVGRSWAIPWQDAALQSVGNDDVKEQLDELTTKDIAALAFSSTYPSQVGNYTQLGPMNPSICYALWDCRTSEISALLFGRTSSVYLMQVGSINNASITNDGLCEFSFLVLDSEAELPINRAYVTVLLGDKRKTGYTLRDGSFESSIPCNEYNPNVEVRVSASGYEPDSQRITLVGNIEKVYLAPLVPPTTTQYPAPTPQPTATPLPLVQVRIAIMGIGFARASETNEARRKQSALLAAQKDANRNFALWKDGAELEAVTIVDQGEVTTDIIREEVRARVFAGTVIEQSYDVATGMAQVTVEYVIPMAQ